RQVPLASFAPSIFVAVKNIRVRKVADRTSQLIKGKRRKEIVVVETRDKITGRQLQRAIGIFRNPEILLELLKTNSRFTRDPLSQGRQGRGLIGPAIDHAKLPVIISLAAHRGEHLIQKARRSVVKR